MFGYSHMEPSLYNVWKCRSNGRKWKAFYGSQNNKKWWKASLDRSLSQCFSSMWATGRIVLVSLSNFAERFFFVRTCLNVFKKLVRWVKKVDWRFWSIIYLNYSDLWNVCQAVMLGQIHAKNNGVENKQNMRMPGYEPPITRDVPFWILLLLWLRVQYKMIVYYILLEQNSVSGKISRRDKHQFVSTVQTFDRRSWLSNNGFQLHYFNGMRAGMNRKMPRKCM